MSTRPPPPPPILAPPPYIPPLTDDELTAMGVAGDATVLRLIEEVRRHRRLLAMGASYLTSAADIILDDVMGGHDIDGDDASARLTAAHLRAFAEGDAAWRPS